MSNQADHRLNLEENSKYRIAYQLMEKVATYENKELSPDEAREYFFELFEQSRRIVNGSGTASVVEEKQRSISMGPS